MSTPIGRVIISLRGTKISAEERALLAHPNIGGVVLYRANYETANGAPKDLLEKFIAEIHAINPNIIMMVDHEGESVWRLRTGFTVLPRAKTLGDEYNANPKTALEHATQQGFIMASELMSLGIISLAPVVDSHNDLSLAIGKWGRAYHTDPKVNAELAEAFIRGMNAAGMPATAKHFPDHGQCTGDSHVALPVDKRTMEELEAATLPYRSLIAKKLLAAVMPAHVVYPAIDRDNTACYSAEWIQNRLHRDLGFDGVVMSDCLNMAGADTRKSAMERFQSADKAGCDFLMLTLHLIKEEQEYLKVVKELTA